MEVIVPTHIGPVLAMAELPSPCSAAPIQALDLNGILMGPGRFVHPDLAVH